MKFEYTCMFIAMLSVCSQMCCLPLTNASTRYYQSPESAANPSMINALNKIFDSYLGMSCVTIVYDRAMS